MIRTFEVFRTDGITTKNIIFWCDVEAIRLAAWLDTSYNNTPRNSLWFANRKSRSIHHFYI